MMTPRAILTKALVVIPVLQRRIPAMTTLLTKVEILPLPMTLARLIRKAIVEPEVMILLATTKAQSTNLMAKAVADSLDRVLPVANSPVAEQPAVNSLVVGPAPKTTLLKTPVPLTRMKAVTRV